MKIEPAKLPSRNDKNSEINYYVCGYLVELNNPKGVTNSFRNNRLSIVDRDLKSCSSNNYPNAAITNKIDYQDVRIHISGKNYEKMIICLGDNVPSYTTSNNIKTFLESKFDMPIAVVHWKSKHDFNELSSSLSKIISNSGKIHSDLFELRNPEVLNEFDLSKKSSIGIDLDELIDYLDNY